MNHPEAQATWMDLVKYKNLIPNADPRVIELFEVMAELVPIKWNYDRLGTFLSWRRKCKDLGLINAREEDWISREMIDGCGGL